MSDNEASDRQLFRQALKRLELPAVEPEEAELSTGVQVWSEDLQEWGYGQDLEAANLDFRESALETFDMLEEEREAELGPIMLDIQGNIHRMIEEQRELNSSS